MLFMTQLLLARSSLLQPCLQFLVDSLMPPAPVAMSAEPGTLEQDPASEELQAEVVAALIKARPARSGSGLIGGLGLSGCSCSGRPGLMGGVGRRWLLLPGPAWLEEGLHVWDWSVHVRGALAAAHQVLLSATTAGFAWACSARTGPSHRTQQLPGLAQHPAGSV